MLEQVMAGLVPAIHVFEPAPALKTWMPATQASEATPFFERLSGHDDVMTRLL
jgi:hypothetical protein